MEIQGTIEGKNIEVADMEFAVEIDSSDLWQEISDSVEECASEAISNYMSYNEPEVDFNDGASNLLHDYNPGNGCSLAREFESAVQGAVLVNGWLAEQVGSPDRDQVKLENTAQLSERNEAGLREARSLVGAHDRRIAALEDSPSSQSQEEIRKVVRSEVRMALAAALTTLTNGQDSEEL